MDLAFFGAQKDKILSLRQFSAILTSGTAACHRQTVGWPYSRLRRWPKYTDYPYSTNGRVLHKHRSDYIANHDVNIVVIFATRALIRLASHVSTHAKLVFRLT